MGIELVVAIAVVIIVLAIIHKYLYYGELTGNYYKKKFALKRFERGLLNEYTKKIKRSLALDFCIEIFVGFYIGVFRELSKNQQRTKKLNFRLMDFCMAIVKKKYYLSSILDDSLYKSTLPGEIYGIVKDKEQLLRTLSDAEERDLFDRDWKRMKRVYTDLVSRFDKNHPEKFYEHIRQIASCYEKISILPLRSLFYNAHSFMADYDRFISLQLYLHYLSVKSASKPFKYKSITKLNVSRLFDGEAQKKKFAAICHQLRQDYDMGKAFDRMDELFMRVRRKISLNISSIKEAKEKHNEVVQILGQYLDSDELPTEKPPIVIKIDDTPDTQKDLFDLFISRSFRLNRQEVNIFVESRGLFRDTFIERINGAYYETFDDLLIEEYEDYYLLNEDYYRQLND
jgi:hypothetical protein